MKLNKSSGKIEHQGSYYLKHFYGDFSAEKEKYAALYELSKNSNFIAPRPVETNDINRTIKFEIVSDIESIRNAYLNSMKAEKADPWQINKFHRIGIALAEIHKGLSLKTCAKWAPSRTFYNAAQKGISHDFKKIVNKEKQPCLHGDFSFSNIFFKKDDNNKPVIFDPSFDGYTIFSTHAVGPAYLDIAHFIACLDGLVPLRHYPYMRWGRLTYIKENFISGYEKESGLALNRDWISWLAFATVSAKFEKRLSVFGKLGVWIVYNRLKGNIPEKKVQK